LENAVPEFGIFFQFKFKRGATPLAIFGWFTITSRILTRQYLRNGTRYR